MALLVLLCGCRAGPRTTDANPFDDGSLGDRRPAAVDTADEGQAGDAALGAPCALLGMSCANRAGCYPFPFESPPNGQARCAFPGGGTVSDPCQSQLECDGTTICSAPGQPDSICLQRCALASPVCPPGTTCLAYAGYSGVGVCSL